jgi:hypothetical protein
MAKNKPTETPPKEKVFTSADEISQCIAKLRARIHQVEELKREGLPYRDALRVTAEYQLRDTIRDTFGERSPEWHQHQNLRIKVNSKHSVNETISLLQHLVVSLEERRLDLLGLRASSADQRAGKSADTLPTDNTPASVSEPKTPKPLPAAVVSPLPPAVPVQAPQVVNTMHPVQSAEPVRAAFTPEIKPPVIELPEPLAAPAMPPAPIIVVSQPKLKLSAEAVAQVPESRPVSAPEPLRFQAAPAPSDVSNIQPLQESSMSPKLRFPSPDAPTEFAERQLPIAAPDPVRNGNDATAPYGSAADTPDEDGDMATIANLRQICLAFHRVARQLRQRRDERPTLEVEDERDVLDLLQALLSIKYDNVEPEEWAPTYASGSTRTDLWLREEGVVIIAKKTKQGIGAKALTHQVSVDFERYGTHPDCRLMFCFIYDPEGRIGHPKGLEGDLTLDYNGRRVEALISPK